MERRIFNVILFLIILFSGTNNFAQTQIDGGNVSGTWTKANSPYIIHGDITIPRFETLNIEPGVEVKFNGQYRFYANGRLLAIGSKADSIRFTAIDSLAGWKGIRFIDQNDWPNQGSEIAFSVFSYGNTTGNDVQSIVDSMLAIVSQRLIRKVCPKCSSETNYSFSETEFFVISTLDPSKIFFIATNGRE